MTIFSASVDRYPLTDISLTVTNRVFHGEPVPVKPDRLSVQSASTWAEVSGRKLSLMATLRGSVSVSLTDGSVVYPVAVTRQTGEQYSGWGTGLMQYMLPVDANDKLIVTPGSNHRKVYVSPNGKTAAQIETEQSLSPGTVTAAYLANNLPSYGASEAEALESSLGFDLWDYITPNGIASSNWLLLERGGNYDIVGLISTDIGGESPLRPLFVGAWGNGGTPIIISNVNMFQDNLSNVIIQDIFFADQLRALGGHKNIILDGVTFSGAETVYQNANGLIHIGITIRNSAFLDAWKTTPVDNDADGFWDPRDSRDSGLFAAGIDGLLFDGVILDHNGWAPDFDPTGAVSGGHPPSLYSHNLYVQWDTTDVTMRDSITMRAASIGAQFRGGAFVVDNLFLDNNVAFNVNGGDYQGHGPLGNYSLLNGNVVTDAAWRGENVPEIGALDWGVRNEAFLTTLIDNIVAHANDPDDPTDTDTSGTSNISDLASPYEANGNVVYRWGGDKTETTGLPPSKDTTTIERFVTDQALPTAVDPVYTGYTRQPIADFAQHVRGLDPVSRRTFLRTLIDYFRTGFGLSALPSRSTPKTLTFIPDHRGEGMRWDNRLNWSTDGVDGIPIDGDTLELNGATVGTHATWNGTINLGSKHGITGRLIVVGGEISGTINGPGEVVIANAGQVTAMLNNVTLTTATAPGTPGAPTVSAIAGGFQIDSLPDDPDDGGAPITGYRLQYSADAGSTWTGDWIAVPGRFIDGLTAGVEVLVRVAAVNPQDVGPYGASAAVTPT